ncbi:MAG TPA: hypothetical protein VGH38_22160 [Bryobacteraceae bacterium]
MWRPTPLPRGGPQFPNLKVVMTKKLRSVYANLGREDFIARMAQFGLAARHLVGGRHVIMLRRALIPDYERAGVEPCADDAYNFSMWNSISQSLIIARRWIGARIVPAVHGTAGTSMRTALGT